MQSRPVAPKLVEDDANYDVNLRPRGFDEYVGQEQVKENLKVAIAAARGRNDVLDHILFHGPPGLGKTRLPRDRWWSVRAIWRRCLRISRKGIFFSLTRFTA